MLKHLDGLTINVICPQFPFLIPEEESTFDLEHTAPRTNKLIAPICNISIGALSPAIVSIKIAFNKLKLKINKLYQHELSLFMDF